MRVVHLICAGVDVHQAQLSVCVRRVVDDSSVQVELRECGTKTGELRELAEWLRARGCSVVGLESTGVYWRPVFHLLTAEGLDVVVGNPHEVRGRPGRKTDCSDAAWLAELLAHGLMTPSFIPTKEISGLRDLTRTRVTLVQNRTQVRNRVYKILEDTNIKLASVVSDLFGKSARAMLDALVGGERDPRRLARLAMGTLRKKIPDLECVFRPS